MTFPAELERLLKTEPDAAVFAISRNHADAILGLARAAECIRHWHDSGKDGMVVSAEHVRNLWEALAKLNGGKG